mgnify:CR=1 FL=1
MKTLNTISLVFLMCVMIVSCGRRGHETTRDGMSVFRRYSFFFDTTMMRSCIMETLDSDQSVFPSDMTVKKRYTDSRSFSDLPVWFSYMGLSPEADSVLFFLREALPENGLDTGLFRLPQISDDIELVRSLAYDSVGKGINRVMARLDYNLSRAYVAYCYGQRTGFMRPDVVFNTLEYKSDTDGKVFSRLFGYELEKMDVRDVVRMLDTHDRVSYMRQSKPVNDACRSLYAQLRECEDSAKRRVLFVNIERCRWRVRQPAANSRHVLVNIPSLHLWTVCPDSVSQMRICCGAKKSKTPLLSSDIRYLQVNPEWIVPQTIVKSDFLRHAGDSAYFASRNYFMTNKLTGDTLEPGKVTVAQLESGKIRIGQRSGDGNSLGRVAFRFSNDYGIYLHDTDNKRAFKYVHRTLSHGCVRVERPYDLTCFLLPAADEWMIDKIRLSMDMDPLTEKGEKYVEKHEDDERPFRLVNYLSVSPEVPLFIFYFTAYPNPCDGKVEYWEDVYGYDDVIWKEVSYLYMR